VGGYGGEVRQGGEEWRSGSPPEVQVILLHAGAVLSLHEADLFDEIASLGAGLREQDLVGEGQGGEVIRTRSLWEVGRSEEIILRLESRLQSLEEIPIESEIAETAAISLGPHEGREREERRQGGTDHVLHAIGTVEVAAGSNQLAKSKRERGEGGGDSPRQRASYDKHRTPRCAPRQWSR
jgi:hypothetical protein